MKNFKVPIRVCWDITSRCNENCSFCYRVRLPQELGIEDNLKILNILSDAGIKKISFVGGEPLLYKNILYLIQEAYSKGIITSLTTNGILLNNPKIDSLSNILDWLSLPLDAPNTLGQLNMSRHIGHFYTINGILDYIKEKNLNINVKINTIASRVNIEQIEKMIPLINKHGIKRWKIFQFFPIRGKAFENWQEFLLTDSEFEDLEKRIRRKTFANKDCFVHFSNIRDLRKSYFSISSDGNVRFLGSKENIVIGSILEKEVTELWSLKYFNISRHFERNKWLLKNNTSNKEQKLVSSGITSN